MIAQEHFERAIELKEVGKYEEAHLAFDKAIEIDQNFARPHCGKGNVFIEQERYEEALSSFDKAMEIDSKYAAPHNGKGNTFLLQGRYEEALLAFDKAMEIDSKLAASHIGKGNALERQGLHEEALSSFSKAVEIAPNEAHGYFGKGNVFYSLGLYKEAYLAYEKAIELAPNAVQPYVGMGDLLWKQRKYDEAHTAFNRAIELDPSFASSYLGKGNTFYEQGQYDRAHAAFDEAIRLNENFPQPHLGKGNAFERQGLYEEAHIAYDRAIWLDKKNVLALYGKGNTFFAQKKYNKAHLVFNEAIKIDPHYAPPHYGKGNIYLDLKEYDAAHAAFDEAIQIAPNFAPPHHGKASLYFSQQMVYHAVKHLNRWVILLGYNFSGYPPMILPLLPFSTLKYTDAYGFPSWKNQRHYKIALQTAIPYKALRAYQKDKKPLSLLEEALFNFYLGDQPACLELLEHELQNRDVPSMQLCHYILRASERCITPLAESLLQKIEDNARSVASDLHRATQEDRIEIYYTGLYYRKNNQLVEALRCFEAIETQHLPARLVKIELLFHLQKKGQAKKELKAFVKDKEAMDQFGLGLYNEPINPDIPLADYLQQYAYHDELRATTNFLNEQSKRFYRTIDDGSALPYFFDLYFFDTPGLNKIYQFFRTTYLRNFYQTYYKEELQTRTRDAFDEATIEDINDAVAAIPHSRAKEILKVLESLPEEENLPAAIAGYFDIDELNTEQALLLNNYFFVNGQASTYDKWKLDFYLIEKATRSGWQPSKPMEGGTKGAVKKLLENPIGAVGETLAVLGATIFGTSVIGGILLALGTKFSIFFLTELLLQYVKSNKSNFNSYADFEDSFEEYIADQRQTLGEDAFRKRFPLEVLQG